MEANIPFSFFGPFDASSSKVDMLPSQLGFCAGQPRVGAPEITVSRRVVLDVEQVEAQARDQL
jgi:hypothetical protein